MASSTSALSSSSTLSTNSSFTPATMAASIFPLQFIPTVQGSSPLAQDPPMVFAANFDTPEEARAYMVALSKAHLQFMQKIASSQTAANPHNYQQTTQFLSFGVRLVKESWRKGDWFPPPLINGKEIETFESNGSMTRLTRVPPETAAHSATDSLPAAADLPDEEIANDPFNDVDAPVWISDEEDGLGT